MNKYLEVIYKNREKSNYPKQLIDYLLNNYFGRAWYNDWCRDLLEIGCGDKTFLNEFKKWGFKVMGINKEDCNLEKNKLPFKNNSFDYIFTKSTIEHINNTDNFISEIYRVLKVGGEVIIITPDWESRYKDFFEDYTHKVPFTRKALQDLLLIYNFRNVKVEKFYQLPFIWYNPYLKFIPKLISLLPDKWKWKDKEQTIHNKLIRFSKEIMLLAIGEKK